MRFLLGLFAMLIAHAACAAGGSQAALHSRCLAAIAASGQPANPNALKENAISMGESGFLFQFTELNGGAFTCQICDDGNPAVNACGSMGLELSYRPKDGEMKRLPAELDKKCAYFLQKELRPPGSAPFIDHALVKKIHVSEDGSTDSRWVYKMEYESNNYRCVVRKSDGSFRVEEQKGDDWKVLANGVLF
jgi:hypothetical protein